MDHFTTKSKALLQDRNHGVLLAGITLVTEMCALDQGVCNEFRQVSYILPLPSGIIKLIHPGNGVSGQTSENFGYYWLLPGARCGRDNGPFPPGEDPEVVEIIGSRGCEGKRGDERYSGTGKLLSPH